MQLLQARHWPHIMQTQFFKHNVFLESVFYFENLFWFNSPTSDSLTCCSKCLPVPEPGFPRSLLPLKGSSSFPPILSACPGGSCDCWSLISNNVGHLL